MILVVGVALKKQMCVARSCRPRPLAISVLPASSCALASLSLTRADLDEEEIEEKAEEVLEELAEQEAEQPEAIRTSRRTTARLPYDQVRQRRKALKAREAKEHDLQLLLRRTSTITSHLVPNGPSTTIVNKYLIMCLRAKISTTTLASPLYQMESLYSHH